MVENIAKPKRLFWDFAHKIPYGFEVSQLIEMMRYLGRYTVTEMVGRAVIVSPAYGRCGHPNSCVIEIEGTPARGSLFVDGVRNGQFVCFYYSHGRMKKLGSLKTETVGRFIIKSFPDKEKPIRLSICRPQEPNHA